MSYSVLYSEDGVMKDISDFVSKISYGGDRMSAARKLDISFLSGTDVFIPKLQLRNGGLLRLLSDEKELIRAVIFKQDRNDKGDFTVTGYTHGIYLTKNKDTKKYTQMTATQIIKQICDEFGIPVGEVAQTQHVIPKLFLREKTLWDMILTALTETTKKSGIEYRVFFREGMLYVEEKHKQIVTWALEEGVNLLSASKSVSIEELRNRVKVIGKLPQGKEAELERKAENEEMQKRYGLMQEVLEDSKDGITESSLQQTAAQRLKELCKEEITSDVDAIGIDDVEAGMAVYVIETTTGQADTYYVEQDDHSIEGNSHTMHLKLSRTDDVPKLEMEGESDQNERGGSY